MDYRSNGIAGATVTVAEFGTSGSLPPKERPTITDKIGRLSEEVDRLDKAISGLSDRISQVLDTKNIPPKTESGCGQSGSPMQLDISHIVDRLTSIRVGVQNIANAVDL